jgi:wyosine [tRNA(Phe)-imidazoG37] synthetase (radical SAM superfamily)
MFDKLQEEIIYGPVISRRLGNSIGINLFPNDTNKYCSFNCIYCFFKIPSSNKINNTNIVEISPDNVVNGLNSWKQKKQDVFGNSEYITFSGNGEPTFHPNFPLIAESVLKWRNANANDKKLAIFTNGSKLSMDEIRNSLLLFDEVFIKLDVGNESDFKKICRPDDQLSFEEYVKGIKTTVNFFKAQNKNITLQTAIIQSHSIYLSNSIDVTPLIKILKEINPNRIDFYELNFDGTSQEKYEYFDFLKYVQTIENSFKDYQIERRFFHDTPRTFYTVYIQYAVDSLLYVPVFIADKANVFLKNGIIPEFRVPINGDLGAVNSVIRGEANFALCDPFVIFSEKIKPEDRTKCSLVEIIIKKVGLWCVCDNRIKNINEIFTHTNTIHTYPEDSTANKVTQWFNKRNKKAIRTYSPGNEFSFSCVEKNTTNNPFTDNSIITADILTSYVCSNCWRKKDTSSDKNILFFSENDTINPFLFTGLIVNTKYRQDYPELVQKVIKSINESIEMFYNGSYLRDREVDFIEYLATLINKKSQPFNKCTTKPVIDKEIKYCLNRLIEEKIYEPKSIFNIRALLNAFIIHSSFNKKIKLSDLFIYLNYYNTKSKVHLITLKLLLILYWLRIKLLPPQRLRAIIILMLMFVISIGLIYIDEKIVGILGILVSATFGLMEFLRNK